MYIGRGELRAHAARALRQDQPGKYLPGRPEPGGRAANVQSVEACYGTSPQKYSIFYRVHMLHSYSICY